MGPGVSIATTGRDDVNPGGTTAGSDDPPQLHAPGSVERSRREAVRILLG
jgi:hypothetical protein